MVDGLRSSGASAQRQRMASGSLHYKAIALRTTPHHITHNTPVHCNAALHLHCVTLGEAVKPRAVETPLADRAN